MKKVILFFATLLIIGALQSCSQNDSSCEAPINPNGSSELAQTMRTMMTYLNDEKQAILESKPKTEVPEGFDKILTATPTEGMEITENYPSYGKHFLSQLDQYKNCADDQRTEVFNALVSSCVNCHTSHCPGPIGAIEKNILNAEI
ncbi:MAG TPA: hypothetical protein PKH65_01915 [Bacteroidia bacterium]|nr:hypothetical protein [Bacteroidia bacterium]HNT79412.1 hypothetical protein [Bacteroidia bacterium]